MYACMHACMHVCMYACMYVCMYVGRYVCMYVCIYIYTYTARNAGILTYVYMYSIHHTHKLFTYVYLCRDVGQHTNPGVRVWMRNVLFSGLTAKP